MTHSQLVQLASKWLKRRFPVVITEMAGGSEEPDAIGFKGGFSCLIECKASKPDFYAERNKPRTRSGVNGMGDHRYYLTTPGLVKLEQLPEKWGLLHAQGRGVYVIKQAELQEKNYRREQALLLSCIRRIGQDAPKGVSVKFYTYETKCRATLGVDPKQG